MMSTRRVVVENGRISVDVDYPDGTELKVTLEADGDPFADMDPEERVKLEASIARGLAQVDEGLGRPAEEVIAELRDRR